MSLRGPWRRLLELHLNFEAFYYSVYELVMKRIYAMRCCFGYHCEYDEESKMYYALVNWQLLFADGCRGRLLRYAEEALQVGMACSLMRRAVRKVVSRSSNVVSLGEIAGNLCKIVLVNGSCEAFQRRAHTGCTRNAAVDRRFISSSRLWYNERLAVPLT